MKKVTNKSTALNVIVKNSRYSDLLMYCINEPVQWGYTIEDMRVRVKLLEKVTRGEGKEYAKEIEFEDAEFSVLKELVKSKKWLWILHKDAVEFVDYIVSVK